jgi:hypothetical protein
MPIACQEFPLGTLHHAIRPSQSGRPARWSTSADEAHELLFDDHAGHALHFGEAAGENGGAGFVSGIRGLRWRWMYGLIAISRYIQCNDFLNGLFGQFLGRGTF